MTGIEENGAYPPTVSSILKGLPHRALALVWKIVSFQGIVFGVATALVWFGKIESYAWLLACILVLFGRIGLDFIKELKK